MSYGRSKRIVMTPEAHILRELRESAGLSMRAAGNLIETSSSWISHLENGRADITKAMAEKLIRAYAGHTKTKPMTYKSFKERARKYNKEDTVFEFIKKNIDRVSEGDANTLKILLEQFLAKK